MQLYKERSKSNRVKRGQGFEHPLYKDDIYPRLRQAGTIKICMFGIKAEK